MTRAMKRLAIIINIFGDGAVPSILLDLYPYLSQAGWVIRVIALQPLDSSQSCVRKATEMGVDLVSLDCKREQFLCTYYRLRKALDAFRPLVIHSHLGRSDFFSVVSSRSSIPKITTFHSVRPHYNGLSQIGYFLTDKRVNLRICVSKKVRDSWYSDGFLSGKHTVIYNPIDPDRLKVEKSPADVRNELGLSPGEQLILNAGRLLPVKGQATLIDALPRILLHYPNMKLAIAGKGKLESSLRNQCDKLGVSHAVKFLGFRQDLPDLISASDLFVFPSLWEGLGLAALEAMFLCTPLVASDIAPITEYVCDGKTGLLVKPSDPVKLAEAIILALSDIGESKRRAVRAYDFVREKFDVKIIADETLSVYDMVTLRAERECA